MSTGHENRKNLDLPWPRRRKTDRWACAVTTGDTKIWNKTLPNDEAKLTKICQELRVKGTVLLVIGQSATIRALAVAVTQHLGITVAYFARAYHAPHRRHVSGHGLNRRKDAFIIADAARSMPHTLRSIQVSDVDEATLAMLTGFDLDLSRQITQISNRIRGLFTQIHPALARALGARLEHDSVLEVLAAWPTPARLRHAGKARIDAKL
ncbi:transposase [Arthrobacter sp. JUb115]|uniref:IS110 family transposase n=1 Tax=Arthrobacter sp. JUb115 TaxID=2485108 RepID=UPI0010DB11BD|nr:transposase [Arthrobacter sp. JUb115]TDU30530.1 transposase [Arthrobacter sp. JUb115]